jgi:hypothetical protein
MVADPPPVPVAMPALLIFATVSSDDDHSVDDVRLEVEASEYVPVAVNCCVPPSPIVAVAGVTAMETSVTPVTVTDALPLTIPSEAVIVAEPADEAVARPELFTDTIPSSEEDHVTLVVMSCVEASEYVPVAVNCWVALTVIDGLAGVTAIDESVMLPAVTVTETWPKTVPDVAVTVAVPADTPNSMPDALTETTPVLEDSHVTLSVMSPVAPSL